MDVKDELKFLRKWEGVGSGGRSGGQGGCGKRIEVFVKIQKKLGGGVGAVRYGGVGSGGRVGGRIGGVQSCCERRIEVFVKIKKKTRTVRGSDYGPAVELSEQKDK